MACERVGGVVIELRCDQDKGYATWNRAKVDANNNKQFDETWTFKKDGTVERKVAPGDDQNYTQTLCAGWRTSGSRSSPPARDAAQSLADGRAAECECRADQCLQPALPHVLELLAAPKYSPDGRLATENALIVGCSNRSLLSLPHWAPSA